MQKEKFLWSHFYKEEDFNLNIPNTSFYNYMMDCTKEYGELDVLNYFGKKITFKVFWEYIDLCAKSLKSLGVRKGDVVTICMPNTPEAVISFFAVNKIGAISNMIHPLSAEEEIKEYLNSTKSTLLIAFNGCYGKVRNIIKETDVYKVVIASVSDYMPVFLNSLYTITKGRKEEKPKNNSLYIFWKEFLSLGKFYEGEINEDIKSGDIACILHSGGTTGIPKSIVLENKSFIGLNLQAKVLFKNAKPRDVMLSVLPIFHCFGLIISMYIPICFGLTLVLVPQFDAKRFDKLLTKYKPNFLAGVPTLFEALTKNEHMANVDLSCVKYVISGGDTLSNKKHIEVNEFLKAHNSKAEISQGYGMTETAGAISFGALPGTNKVGGVGAPFPGNIVKICDPETNKELKPNETGEICISGFCVMRGYLDNEKATDEVLKLHSDGRKYIHTGDLGYLDEDGVLFYVQRMKRIIVSSGYNVYPQYIENTLKELDYVKDACVVGVPHPYKGEVVKAFILLEDKVDLTYTIQKNIMDYAKKNLAHYMLPKEYIFKDSFPKTKMLKVDYKKLQEELINRK